MKAQVLYGIGNIKLTNVDEPVPRNGEALVRVMCCGICGSDIPRIYKSGAHNMPIIPGHEFSGVVEECKDKPALVGKRVGVFPLIPCRECSQCRAGHYEMCENYDYLGSRNDGGFAEYVAVPIWNLVPLPDDVSFIEAAMLEPMSVAVHSIKRAGLLDKKNNALPDCRERTIVICGLGTIGLLTCRFLFDAGYERVYVIGNKDIQKEKFILMGGNPEYFCDVRYKDPIAFVMSASNNRGADNYFECVGRPENVEQAIKCTAPLGTLMLVGNPASDMELKKDTYWKILRKQMTVLGTWNSSYDGRGDRKKKTDDWQYVIDRLSSLKTGNLVTHVFDLEHMSKGLDIMKRKSEDYVKIMVKMV